MSFWFRHSIFGLLVVMTVTLPLYAFTVRAAEPAAVAEAQSQVEKMLGPLGDSEAERASGSYVPGVGVIFTLDLLRGPNVIQNRPPYAAVRDWMIYLLQTFGPTLTAIPPEETIAMVVNYYDFSDNIYHRMTMSSLAGEVADPGTYSIWLDNLPYNDAVAAIEGASVQETPTPAATSEPPAPTTAPEPTAVATPAIVATPLAAAPINVTAPFDAAPSLSEWSVASGHWDWVDGTYEQNELGKFDLVTYYQQPILGNYRISASVKYIEGEMGAGLVFNGLNIATKKGAQMVSFAGNGTYLQWGYFNADGIFQYEGGAPIKVSTADGQWHAIAVDVTGNSYQVSLDDVVIGTGLLSQQTAGGYAGLLASTSKIQFDNVRIESLPS